MVVPSITNTMITSKTSHLHPNLKKNPELHCTEQHSFTQKTTHTSQQQTVSTHYVIVPSHTHISFLFGIFYIPVFRLVKPSFLFLHMLWQQLIHSKGVHSSVGTKITKKYGLLPMRTGRIESTMLQYKLMNR